MIALEYWIETPLVNALGWTLFCFVWQAALIASILAAILLLWRPASARARYGLACLAMAAMPAAFGLTLIRSVPPTRDAATAPLANAGPALDSRQISSGWIGSFPPNLYSRLPWVVPFWMTGVACFYLYSVAGWMAARSLRRTGVLPAALEWRERLSALADRLRLKTPILLLESSRVDVPVVIGVWRPAILLPVALLTGLPAGQLELILIHELAHIRRYDYLVNLLQKCVEALLFYHPAVWWVSGLIRIERENCCDDIVVEASGEPREYALTLATLEWNRSAARAALAANGGSLMKRIRRMLKEPETSRAAYAPVFSAGLLLLSIGLALAALQAKPIPQAQTAPGGDLQPGPYRKWLHEVSYIMTEPERAAFQRLQTDAEREAFIASFWEHRNPTPGAAENKAKEEYYRRISYANEHFSAGGAGWETDRGRIYVTYGPPDEIESHPRGDTGSISVPNEQWRYRHIEGRGDNLAFGFTDPAGTGEYHLTSNPLSASVQAPQTIRVGAQVQEQNLITKIDPVYPPLATQARIQGTVRFNATIGKDGSISDLQLISGHPMLVEAAKTAVVQWNYRPTLLNGNPVNVVTTVDVNFTLGPK